MRGAGEGSGIGPVSGSVIELDVGPIAAGGHCVARSEGQVVFVRHSLPGERVKAQVTEVRKGFLRADATEILRASADRVAAPCPLAGPDGCGGCDFQHVAVAAQRGLKAAVVAEQLARIAGIDSVPLTVEPLPGGAEGWRTRMRYVAGPDGRLGLRKHRSHEVVPVDHCRIAHPDIQTPPQEAQRAAPGQTVEVVRDSGGAVVVLPGQRPPAAAGLVVERAVGREFSIAADCFWQVHPAAASTLAAAVVELLGPRAGERAWDLYGGAGLFAAALLGPIGDAGQVTIVEADRRGTEAARRCFAGCNNVRAVRGDVASVLGNPRWRSIDLVVADPPRTGLGARVAERIASRDPRAVALVSCDPATFARDVRAFAALGYRLDVLRAFDAFPMTQHVEVVGRLVRRA
ncbi:MAG: class I SAM-dependent RNA methyltransferase [Micromonosporaceae bacterium]|nr:class I SAM-dependent RNA methyltransferase [Micromonosporaceae bacterium]